MTLLSWFKIKYNNYKWRKLIKELSKAKEAEDKKVENVETWKTIMSLLEKD